MQKSLSLALFSCFLTSLSAEVPKAKIAPVFEGVAAKRPIAVLVSPGPAKQHFLVEQRGKVRILPADENGTEATPFLSLSERKLEADKGSEFEEGLVGMAFHPKYVENRKFYLCYTLQDPKRLVLSEMQTSSAVPTKADPATERVLLELPLPFWNHHGGNLAFGPDGFLYLGIGDGGGPQGGDPLYHGQNTFSLCAKILRLDVNGTSGALSYGIPADNPFVGKPGHRPEIFATGIRNPWGMAFDAEGTLWFCDVGQNLWEEVNLLEKGGNYGWNFREGTVAYPGRTDAPPATAKFVEPIHTYSRDQGISITGGLVYRGEKLPALKGAYIYGDWGSGRIWALRYDKAGKKVISNEVLIQPSAEKNPNAKPTAFSEDAAGEILVLDWGGKIFRIVAGE